METPLDTLADEYAIRRVLHLYCRGIDRRDYDLVRSCYTTDGVDDHGKFCGLADEFVEFVRAELPARFATTMHYVSNIVVDVDRPTAAAESYVVAYCRLASEAGCPTRDYVTGLRYVDRFRRDEDAWRIARRTCVYEWSRTDEVAPAPFPDSFHRGRDFPADLVYTAPSA